MSIGDTGVAVTIADIKTMRALNQLFLNNRAWADEMTLKDPGFFTSLVQQMLISLMNDGKGNLDHSAIVTFIEQMANLEVKKP